MSGYVLSPDGVAVSEGSVTFSARGTIASATVGRDGRFRLVPREPGPHDVSIDVAGFTPYRLTVSVPLSKRLMLPPIRLSPAVYYRVRFLTPQGRPIAMPLIVRQPLEESSRPMMAAPAANRRPAEIGPDGTAAIGPLPRGIARLAFDTPPHARMRLADVLVTGASALIDGGTFVAEPGARLEVAVVDGAGAPVPDHEVYLEDAVPPSPLSFPVARTDQEGRAVFERLGSGRYRLHTRAAGLCRDHYLSIAREIIVAGSGEARTRS